MKNISMLAHIKKVCKENTSIPSRQIFKYEIFFSSQTFQSKQLPFAIRTNKSSPATAILKRPDPENNRTNTAVFRKIYYLCMLKSKL